MLLGAWQCRRTKITAVIWRAAKWCSAVLPRKLFLFMGSMFTLLSKQLYLKTWEQTPAKWGRTFLNFALLPARGRLGRWMARKLGGLHGPHEHCCRQAMPDTKTLCWLWSPCLSSEGHTRLEQGTVVGYSWRRELGVGPGKGSTHLPVGLDSKVPRCPVEHGPSVQRLSLSLKL